MKIDSRAGDSRGNKVLMYRMYAVKERGLRDDSYTLFQIYLVDGWHFHSLRQIFRACHIVSA